MKKSKAKANSITFKEFLKMLRPDLRPSLASKEFHKFLCWLFAEIARETDPRTNGMLLEKIRTLPITELIPGIEVEVERRVLEGEQHFKKNGFSTHHHGMIADLLAKYPEWRKRETSRRRAEAARKKAEKATEAKAEAERIKSESKLARKKKPHTTGLVDVEKEFDRQSFENWQSREDDLAQ